MKNVLFLVITIFFLASCATIHDKAGSGDISGFKSFLSEGGNVNKKDKLGRTPLMLAVKEGKLDMIRYLLENGADVNAVDKEGYNVLMYTKYQMLFIWALEVSKRSDDNNSPTPYKFSMEVADLDKKSDKKLHVIEYYTNSQEVFKTKQAITMLPTYENKLKTTVKILLDNGAKVNVYAKDNDSSLNYSIRFNRIDITKMLLEKNADVDKVVLFMKNKETNTVGLTCDEADLFENKIVKSKEYFCSETYKCKASLPNCIDYLDSKRKYDDDENPLMFAAKHGLLETIDKLVAKGFDVNSVDEDEESALFYAAKYEESEALEKLFKLGAKIDLKNKYNKTALLVSVSWDSLPSIEKLIELGADPNSTNGKGLTPLMVAVKKRNPM